eukprot:353697-Amphidinium_carterae.1
MSSRASDTASRLARLPGAYSARRLSIYVVPQVANFSSATAATELRAQRPAPGTLHGVLWHPVLDWGVLCTFSFERKGASQSCVCPSEIPKQQKSTGVGMKQCVPFRNSQATEEHRSGDETDVSRRITHLLVVCCTCSVARREMPTMAQAWDWALAWPLSCSYEQCHRLCLKESCV